MSSIVREFNSLAEFMKYLDDEISEHRRRLGELLKRLEELRVRAEQEKKLKSVLTKLGVPESGTSNEVALRNLRIIINPAASQELTAMESAIEALNNRIAQLSAIRKEVEVLGGLDVEVRLAVVYVDGLPRVLLLRM
jgi:DNA repair exonuclease SbcCD ATPase subunit